MSTFDDDDWTDVTQDEIIAVTHPKTEQNLNAPKQVPVEPMSSGTSLTILGLSDLPFPREVYPYRALQRTAQTNLDKFPKAPIFHVTLGADITAVFLKGLPTVEKQQQFNCHACKQFMRGVGQLALVNPKNGNLIPLFWDANAHYDCFKDSVQAIADMFVGKKVEEQSKLTEKVRKHVGDEERGGKYKHMSFQFPKTMVARWQLTGFSTPNTAELASMLGRILDDYDTNTVDTAASLLIEDKLPDAARHKGALWWLQELIESDRLTKKQSDISRHNLICLEASSAYLGCVNTLRSGAASTLLSSVKSGFSFEQISSAWRGIVDPLAYMRPSAAPKAGNIQAAERLFAELGLTESDLTRAYLAPEEIPESAFLYRQPTEAKGKSGSSSTGIFQSVTPRKSTTAGNGKGQKSSPLAVPPTSISFAKFVSKVLPTAMKVEHRVPEKACFHFFITGLPNTKPLMQWHNESNLASHYVYVRERNVRCYGLSAGWVAVSRIVTFPHMWDRLPVEPNTLPSDDATEAFQYKSHGIRYLVCLDGIKEESTSGGGAALFPAFMKR